MLFRDLIRNIRVRCFCTSSNFTERAVDWDYLSNPSNLKEISSNVILRKVPCELQDVLKGLQQLHQSDPIKAAELKKTITPKLFWFPNVMHPRVARNRSEEPVVLHKMGSKTAFTYFPSTFDNLTKRLNLLRTKNLGQMCGSKSYFLKNDLALLEQSLIRYAVEKLTKKGFMLMSVPDILDSKCFESCGMRTENKHSQVYHIHNEWAPKVCLSGTSEMALANYFSGKTLDVNELPLKVCAVSRCFRAEANKHQKEKGIFRVHYFNKVEMFSVTPNESGNESEEMLNYFVDIQKELYSELGLHFKVLEMPPCELGLPAYHKIDVEAWIPTQKLYGEISSTSNCTDYQSRRLNITYSPGGNQSFCHTINGTACAIPRLLITILENFQNLDGSITVPIPLRKFMKKNVISEKFNEVSLCLRPIP